MTANSTVRRRLVTLVLAFMVPTVAAAILAIFYVYQQERRSFERTLVEATRALSLVVDRDLARREATLQTLAASPTLTTRDLAAFHAYAREVVPTFDSAIVLSDLQGQQLLNSRRPLGEPLPRTVFSALREKAGAHATLVSNVYFAPIGKQHSFAVEVPVVRNGQVVYYLSMGNFAAHMQKVLADQRLPDGWVGTVLDGEGNVVARTHAPERFVGTKPPAQLLAQAEASQGQTFVVPAMEGHAVRASFNRAPGYRWAVFIGVPESQITSPVRAAAGFGLAALALMLAAWWGALQVGRRLVQPITELAGAAQALGRGEAVARIETGLQETDAVALALSEAATSIRSSSAQMEQRVRQALDDAEKVHRTLVQNQRLEALGQLTGGVAHDFNNLLMVVNTNVHLLRARHPALASDAQLQRIDRAVSTGSKLTRQLLAFARRQPLRPEVIDLATTLPELMELIRPTLGSSVAAGCEVAPGTGCIEADPAELELAIINLAMNARDAMPEGGTLRLAAHPAEDGEAVLIEVTDTGQGIPPEILDKVFEPFFTTKDVGRGTGLGLSQVWGLAQQAGGVASIRSTPGQGTTVSLHLPRARRRPSTDATMPGTRRIPPGCEVLLVEDNGELALAGAELLTEAGCRVFRAGNADEALALLDAGGARPHVVLSDIRMPGSLDGIGLARRLRTRTPAPQVVLMTGYTGELEAARAAGLEVLAKPVAPAQLLTAVALAAVRVPAQSTPA
jgi:signal transduction histidine kinase/CheY-like chemotaxis protein